MPAITGLHYWKHGCEGFPVLGLRFSQGFGSTHKPLANPEPKHWKTLTARRSQTPTQQSYTCMLLLLLLLLVCRQRRTKAPALLTIMLLLLVVLLLLLCYLLPCWDPNPEP